MNTREDADRAAYCPVAERPARAELDRMLGDPRFHGTERHRKLLRYLVDEFFAGRSASVKAYTIAIDVFARPSSFDPATDPIVRVEASRLRAALAQYYEALGDEAALRIELPKGNYVPLFVRADGKPSQAVLAPPTIAPDAAEPPPPSPSAVAVGRRISMANVAIASAGVLAMAAAFYVSMADHFPWKPILSEKPTVVVDVQPQRVKDGEEQRKIGDYLVHALSQFSSVRTLAQEQPAGIDVASVTGWVAPRPAVRLAGSKEYRLSISYSMANDAHELAWQVVDPQSSEALRSGVSKLPLESGDAHQIQQTLLVRLARALAGEDGVITSLEAARQVSAPSLGYGCVLQADMALARTDPENLASALACLERSLAYNANDADVSASLAMILVVTGEADTSPIAGNRALKLADKAVALAPQASQSYVAQMMARFAAGDTEAAFLSGQRASALNPLDEAIPARLGLLQYISGHWSEGVRLARLAEANGEYVHHDAALTLALDAYRGRRYEEALLRVRQLANTSDLAVNLLRLAVAGQLGLTQEAASALDEVRAPTGPADISLLAKPVTRSYAPELAAMIEDGLGKAGVRPAENP
ncbi:MULTISPECIES: hypothetical protein [Ensifer]|jgi:tetratricopeptide (TPR) repeat protein|uniref:hypothetical protein n=1 Tax=Ensifer TaxID=106591 RepID=UPI000A9BC2B5|nr:MULTISPECIES: hypothetical protein [Ensifer]MDP9631497.1 tetratricopeptide (TPR) repeat protein [Ensifer adhaerens]NOV18664.1 hypothetical protein [Ensifer canadensis]